MKRCIPLLILVVLAFVALPAAAQPGPFSIGAYAGADAMMEEADTFYFIPFGASARFSIFDWLALRVDAGASYFMGEKDWYFDAAAGFEIPIFAGFYAKAMGGTWKRLNTTKEIYLPYIDAGIGYGIGGFFVEGSAKLFFIEDVMLTCPSVLVGYRFGF